MGYVRYVSSILACMTHPPFKIGTGTVASTCLDQWVKANLIVAAKPKRVGRTEMNAVKRGAEMAIIVVVSNG